MLSGLPGGTIQTLIHVEVSLSLHIELFAWIWSLPTVLQFTNKIRHLATLNTLQRK
jgi:hypothetical protein